MAQSNEPCIEVMNEAIALFMGLKPRLVQPPDPALHCIEVWYNNESQPMKYHTSWDWLMPVVEKIGSLLKDHHLTIEVMSTYNSAYFWSLESGQREITNKSEPKLIETVYAAVYQFIQWLNQQKQNNEQRTNT